jgi:hypothetical protein
VGEELDSPHFTPRPKAALIPRMNRTPEQPDRLSPSRPFLSASLGTRPPRIVSESTSHRICGTVVILLVATFVCNKDRLSLYHWEGRRLLPRGFWDILSSSHFHRDDKAALANGPGASLLDELDRSFFPNYQVRTPST